MRFTRYPKGEAYQITPRKLAAARRAVQKEKDRYPLFPELLKHQTAEDRLASIAAQRETWWQEMRERQAQLWRKARQTLGDLPTGPRAAIKRYWEICGCPGDPVYLLTMIHNHKVKKSLLLASHGRAPAAAALLPKIKLTGSQALNSPESGPVTSCLEWRNFQHSATPSTPAVEDEDDDEFEDDWKVHQRSVQTGNRSPTVKPGSR